MLIRYDYFDNIHTLHRKVSKYRVISGPYLDTCHAGIDHVLDKKYEKSCDKFLIYNLSVSC